MVVPSCVFRSLLINLCWSFAWSFNPQACPSAVLHHPSPISGLRKGALESSSRLGTVSSTVVANSPWGVAAGWFERLQSGDGPGTDVVDSAPSWEELQERLRLLQTPEERDFRKNLEEGCGPPSSLATVRLFGHDASAAERFVFWRDSASWCPYCHKVWMLLEEKEIPYTVKKVNMNCYGGNKPQDFLKIQPSGTIPAAVIDGVPVQSSEDIIPQLLSWPGSSSALDMELDSRDDPRTQELVRLSEMLFFVWLRWLGMFGMKAQEHELQDALQRVEDALSDDQTGPYFLGKRFSVTDIMFVPYLERAAASLLYAKGIDLRDGVTYPAIHDWFTAMESRQSYQNSKTDYYTHTHNVPSSLGGFPIESSGEQARAEIDGGAWKVPLGEAGIEPAWSWISLDEAHREAAERVINNRADVARFAARGAGLAGFPPAAAELADPNAIPSEVWTPCVDVLLRHTVALLLAGGAPPGGSIDKTTLQHASVLAAAGETAASIPSHACKTAAECLEYLQRRIGVPRDMSLPAATCLRAHLGSLIEILHQGRSV